MTGYVGANLGTLPGGAALGSIALACSLDGSITTGASYDGVGLEAVYWDASNVIHRLTNLGADSISLAYNCTDDGQTIVGGSTAVAGLIMPALWTAPFSGAPTEFPIPASHIAGAIRACSVTASVCVGFTQHAAIDGDQIVPVIWNAGIPTVLPIAGGCDGGSANDCSALGDIIVGYCFDSITNFQVPVRWQGGPSWVVSVLGTLAGGVGAGISNNFASACISDGGMAVGAVADASNNAFVCDWLSTALSAIGGAFGGAGSIGYGCNASGAVIAGSSSANKAAVWISGVGQELPPPALILTVEAAYGVSSNAGVVVGGPGGLNIFSPPTGSATKWTWTGPGPGPLPSAVLNMDNVVVTSLATESPCTVAQYTTPPSVSPAVGLRWSDTRGETFGNPVPQTLSTDPLTQLQWNRTGYARGRVFELFWSAAAKTALNGAFVEVEPWKS